MKWKKLSFEEINTRVGRALGKNLHYGKQPLLGLPATYLDRDQFYEEAPFLSDAPFLKTLIANPNHIGVHTLGNTEPFFAGTQELEAELIEICANEILKAGPNQCDGYVASGGTEANMQAIWVYRNYFIKEKNAKHEEIAVVFSKDAHYSMYKACNIQHVQGIAVNVHENDRKWDVKDLETKIIQAKENGIKHFIVVVNMGTTMFGSVDDPEAIISVLKQNNVEFKMHVDAAFGGFIYPFTNPNNPLNFGNEFISSVTLDAHKMLQAPYGTGIFIVRKGYIQYALTPEASYVKGADYTMCGSRSGANAISVWMILMTHGPEGWRDKVNELYRRTCWMREKMEGLGIACFQEPYMNLLTIHTKGIPNAIAEKYHLVADDHDNPLWWKIVVMPHVTEEALMSFYKEVKESVTVNN